MTFGKTTNMSKKYTQSNLKSVQEPTQFVGAAKKISDEYEDAMS